MLRIAFTATDLTRLRLAHSPLVEVVTSSFALNQPAGYGTAGYGMYGHGTAGYGMYGSWRARVRPLVARAGLETMLAVVRGPAGYVPDFLTPAPVTARPSLGEEVRVVAATPLERVAAEVGAAWAGHPAPPQIARFATDPAGGLADLVQEIRRYFQLAIAPIWPRLRAVAEAEIAGRARTAAERGPRALLDDLHPHLDWDGSALRLASAKSREWELDGHALTLLPAGFAGARVHTMTEAPTGRALWYPPGGYGRLGGPAGRPEPGSSALAALAALLGPTRAAVLTLLAVPSSTGEVAAALQLAPATASHHLTILRDAGLVVPERAGRRLRYLRTPLGEQLTTGGGEPPAGSSR